MKKTISLFSFIMLLFLPVFTMKGWASDSLEAEPFSVEVSIDSVNFKDAVFRSLVSEFDLDHSSGLSEEEIAEVTVIDCSGLGIGSLDGLGHFHALKMLNCANNEIETLDLRHCMALTSLDCSKNPLTELNLSSCPSMERICEETYPSVNDGVICYSTDAGILRFDEGLLPNGACVLISFDAAGGSFGTNDHTAIKTAKILKGTVVEKPEDPIRNNYSLENWYTLDTTEIFDFSKPVNNDTELYAQWAWADSIHIGKGLELNENIVINIYARDFADSNLSNYMLQASFPDQNQNRVTVVEGDLQTLLDTGIAKYNANNRLVIPVAYTISYQMTEDVHVKVTHTPTNTIVDEFDYSVRQYCENMITNNPNDAKLVAVCTATLDFGAYAQKQFGYKTDDLANRTYSAGAEVISQTVIPDTYNISSTTGTCTGISKAGRTLNIIYSSELWIRFKPDDLSTLGDYTFTVNDKPAEATIDGDRFRVVVPGVPAPDLDTVYRVTATHKDGSSITAVYSALAYAYNNGNPGKSGVLADLCRSLYRYFDAAAAYFG